jgi:hypothetical protein
MEMHKDATARLVLKNLCIAPRGGGLYNYFAMAIAEGNWN